MVDSQESGKGPLVLVTGVTGYVGGRLVPRLLERGYRVRVLVRGGPERLAGRAWVENVQVTAGDVLAPTGLDEALAQVDIAYYLVHTMRDSRGSGQRDGLAADNFSRAARSAGVKRIIYLGGLGDLRGGRSDHLQSRQATGDILRQSAIPVTEFRAGLIVGSGSLAFEMVRHKTERLPVMLCPRWVFVRTHPISIRDVLRYLVTALETPESEGQIIEIGGADTQTFADMIRCYARIRGLRRLIIAVPVSMPRLSSYYAHWVTPIPAGIALSLIKDLRTERVVRDSRAKAIFPEIVPIDYETAVLVALRRFNDGQIETIWSDALASSEGDTSPVQLTQEQGMLIERRQMTVAASPAVVFRTFSGMGGDRGWPPYTWLWQIRGAIDRLLGGVGMRRGRRHPDQLREGEALDFWRVERLEPDHKLRLRAEMKLPGQGWLQYETRALQDDQSELIQTAYFAPKGLSGLLYWYGIYPIHGLIFGQTIAAVARRAEETT